MRELSAKLTEGEKNAGNIYPSPNDNYIKEYEFPSI